MSLNRQSISSDITHLLSIPPSSISSILDTSSISTPPQSSKTKVGNEEGETPIEILNSFSPNQSTTPDQTQLLVKAYIREMGDVKILQREGEIDKLGDKIDGLRERGQGLEGVLSEIKV